MSESRKKRPLLDACRVKFFTRSFSLELYRQASRLFEGAGYPCVRLTDQTADGYFFSMLDDKDCDVAINVDEDAYIENIDAVLDLAEYVLENGYANAGCPDCAPGCPRGGNPIVTNPFFNVFDLKKIRTKWRNRKDGITEVRKFRYDEVKKELRQRFEYDESLIYKPHFESIFDEPYYNFFFWLAYNFRTLYLPNAKHHDGTSTILYSIDGRIICKHSWMSRFYHQRADQTIRINALIDEVCLSRGISRLEFNTSQIITFRLDHAKRFIIRVPQRIANWPRKWKKWYDRWQRERKSL